MSTNGPATLRLMPGGGEMVDALEDALDRVRSGELEGIVICGITSLQTCGWTWAHKDGIPAPWPRLLAAVASAEHELVAKGLE